MRPSEKFEAKAHAPKMLGGVRNNVLLPPLWRQAHPNLKLLDRYTPLFPLSRLFSFSRNQFWNIVLSSDDANIIRPTIKKDGHLFPPSHRVPATKKNLLPTYRSNEYIRRNHAVPYNVLYLLLHGRAKSELFCAFFLMVVSMPFGYSLFNLWTHQTTNYQSCCCSSENSRCAAEEARGNTHAPCYRTTSSHTTSPKHKNIDSHWDSKSFQSFLNTTPNTKLCSRPQ
jgi:hypothetical protein